MRKLQMFYASPTPSPVVASESPGFPRQAGASENLVTRRLQSTGHLFGYG